MVYLCPYFFEDDGGRQWILSDTSTSYGDASFQEEEIEEDTNVVVFQKDGASPQPFNHTHEYLKQYFPGDKLIQRRTDNSWPPFLPDPNPSNCFLQLPGMYQNNQNAIDRLNENSRGKSGEFRRTLENREQFLSEWRTLPSSKMPGLNTPFYSQ